MARFDFAGPPPGDTACDLLTARERLLRVIIDDIVQSAVEAGWSEKDVLLALVEISWNMYEGRDAPGE